MGELIFHSTSIFSIELIQYYLDNYQDIYHSGCNLFNHRDHKDFTQRTRRNPCAVPDFFFVYFVVHLLMNKVLKVQVSDPSEPDTAQQSRELSGSIVIQKLST